MMAAPFSYYSERGGLSRFGKDFFSAVKKTPIPDGFQTKLFRLVRVINMVLSGKAESLILVIDRFWRFELKPWWKVEELPFHL